MIEAKIESMILAVREEIENLSIEIETCEDQGAPCEELKTKRRRLKINLSRLVKLQKPRGAK